MPSRLGRIQLSISRSLYAYFAILLLLIPVRLLLAAVLSAFVHEMFHIAMLLIMKIDIYGVHVGIRGAKIETAPMAHRAELLCALAGPLGGLMLLALFRWMPVVALTGAVQSLYNLLPIYPTDGGRVLKCGLSLLLPERIACSTIYILEVITLSAITAFCVYASVWLELGVIPVIFSSVLILQCAKRNYPCKPCGDRVQ